jgi:anaerobic magnesium-protoporphyrin IX monomethyl ester cyclase
MEREGTMRILLIVYDNESYLHWFPCGTAYLAAALLEDGHDVEIYNQDVHHYLESHLTRHLDTHHYDVVGLGFVGNYFTHKKVLKISEAINASKNRPHYILGGHGASADPGYFMRKTGADAVVVGEGEKAVLDAIHGDGVFKRPQIENLDDIPWPAYEKFPINHYRLWRRPHASSTDFVMPVVSARGCIFKCNFCYRMEDGYRKRSTGSVVEEIKYLRDTYGITYIEFTEELTMASVARATEIAEAMMPLKLKWACNGRLNFAKPGLLKLMKRSGCLYINYGIEALDDEVLKTMSKKLTVKQIREGIEATLSAGISPALNVIFGHIGDTSDTLRKGMEFILKYDDGIQCRTIPPVTPYPGSELFKEAIRRGLLKDTEDFYRKHRNSDLLTVNFTNMTDEEFHKALFETNVALLKNHYRLQFEGAVAQIKDLYQGNTNFRGLMGR